MVCISIFKISYNVGSVVSSEKLCLTSCILCSQKIILISIKFSSMCVNRGESFFVRESHSYLGARYWGVICS